MKNYVVIAFIGLAVYCGEINSRTISVTLGSCDSCGDFCNQLPNSTVTCTRVDPTDPATEGEQVTVTTSGSAKCYANGGGCTDSISASSSTTGGSYTCTCKHKGGYLDI